MSGVKQLTVIGGATIIGLFGALAAAFTAGLLAGARKIVASPEW